MQTFSATIQNFALIFAAMQKKRHDADYDPSAKFFKSSVKSDVAIAKSLIEKFPNAPMKDRRAFASWILLKTKTYQ
jgi:hypothetical protein